MPNIKMTKCFLLIETIELIPIENLLQMKKSRIIMKVFKYKVVKGRLQRVQKVAHIWAIKSFKKMRGTIVT